MIYMANTLADKADHGGQALCGDLYCLPDPEHWPDKADHGDQALWPQIRGEARSRWSWQTL